MNKHSIGGLLVPDRSSERDAVFTRRLVKIVRIKPTELLHENDIVSDDFVLLPEVKDDRVRM